jgi:hypothetical protein
MDSKWYTAYDMHGKILASYTATENTAELNKPENSTIIEGQYSPETGYIDVNTNKFFEFVGRPTEPFFKFNYITKEWEDTRNIEQLKEAKWEKIRNFRNEMEYGGFYWNNYKFDSDLVSQSKIQGAVQLALLSPENFLIDWTLADNSVVSLNAEQMIEVGKALATHIITQHASNRIKRDQTMSATNVDELKDFDVLTAQDV